MHARGRREAPQSQRDAVPPAHGVADRIRRALSEPLTNPGTRRGRRGRGRRGDVVLGWTDVLRVLRSSSMEMPPVGRLHGCAQSSPAVRPAHVLVSYEDEEDITGAGIGTFPAVKC